MEGIYLLRFNNGDTYVGRASNVEKRVFNHYYSLKNNAHKNKKMQNIYNKHGKFTWELLESVSPDNQGEREIYWINELSPTINLTKGGDGGELLTEEEKKRRKVEVYNDEYKANMSKVLKEKGHKISESRKKLYENPDRKKWLIEHSGIHNSTGYKNQKTRGDSPIAKKVINIITGEIYGSLKDVAEKNNINYKSLIVRMKCYKGRPNTTPYRYLGSAAPDSAPIP